MVSSYFKIELLLKKTGWFEREFVDPEMLPSDYCLCSSYLWWSLEVWYAYKLSAMRSVVFTEGRISCWLDKWPGFYLLSGRFRIDCLFAARVFLVLLEIPLAVWKLVELGIFLRLGGSLVPKDSEGFFCSEIYLAKVFTRLVTFEDVDPTSLAWGFYLGKLVVFSLWRTEDWILVCSLWVWWPVNEPLEEFLELGNFCLDYVRFLRG